MKSMAISGSVVRTGAGRRLHCDETLPERSLDLPHRPIRTLPVFIPSHSQPPNPERRRRSNTVHAYVQVLPWDVGFEHIRLEVSLLCPESSRLPRTDLGQASAWNCATGKVVEPPWTCHTYRYGIIGPSDRWTPDQGLNLIPRARPRRGSPPPPGARAGSWQARQSRQNQWTPLP